MQLNWSKIRNKNPNSFYKFTEWLVQKEGLQFATLIIDDNNDTSKIDLIQFNGTPSVFNDIRALYDFFDESNVIVEVAKNGLTNWGYTVMFGNSMSHVHSLTSRQESEFYGFEMAFRFLEGTV
jgi:hypothetical protein